VSQKAVDDVSRLLDRPGLQQVIAAAEQATGTSSTDDNHEDATPVEPGEVV
jgi:hypothetical protein